MSDSKGFRQPVARRPVVGERSAAPTLWSDYQQRTWAERAPVAKVLPSKAPPAAAVAPGISRHAAITGSLQSYANYKTWADRVRTNWEPDKDKVG